MSIFAQTQATSNEMKKSNNNQTQSYISALYKMA